MCTLSFVPKSDGFLLGMNRDDLFARAETQPPVAPVAERTALYPTEKSGGTWIGVNDAGLVFSLLNWNRPAGEKLRSRGELIPELLGAGDLADAERRLRLPDLGGMHPFRLIGFSLSERRICEWRWDGDLSALDFHWQHRHWFSSGLSDDDAERRRGAVCRTALSQPDALSLDWLRRLHRSHDPQPGPFSICAHRETAGTLSYTEVIVAHDSVTMNYTPASPCSGRTPLSQTLALKQPQPARKP